jgi:hypothetical protein
MIKRLDDITIGDFNQMETTGKISQYKKWYNFLPAFLFVKMIRKLVLEIQKFIDEHDLDEDLDRVEWKTRSYLEIQEHNALYLIIVNILINGVMLKSILKKINFKNILNRKISKVLKTDNSESLKNALAKIKEKTGIEIKSIDEIMTYKEYIEHLRDKWDEMFKKRDEEEKPKKITLLQYASSFVIYTGGTFIGLTRMKIIELAVLKSEAEKKYNAERAMYDKLTNKYS